MTDAMAGFVAAISRLPAYVGMTWRAAGFELTGPFTSDVPLPTTRDLRVATENFRVGGAHLFLTTAGRDIAPLSAHPSDQEVVLLPGARLVPASAFHDVEGLRIQVILEQPAPGVAIPAAPTDDEIGELVRAARTADDAAIHQPGRFGA
jgi:hypothetical protein